MNQNDYMLLQFKNNQDPSGNLISHESLIGIPFEIKRVFYIFNFDTESVRANHAHYNTEEVIICLRGSCSCTLDNAMYETRIDLSSPDKGLYIGRQLWLKLSAFSSDCVLLVLASSYYDDADYIKDYASFIEIKSRKENIYD